jgi:hypothetical protein
MKGCKLKYCITDLKSYMKTNLLTILALSLSTTLSFICSYFMNVTLNNAEQYLALVGVLFVDGFFGIWAGTKREGFKTYNALKVLKSLFFWIIFIALNSFIVIQWICRPLLALLKLGKRLQYEDAAVIIGKHFPDTDARYAGINSRLLLSETAQHVRHAGYEIGNIDATIIAQAPKMAPHLAHMVTNIAADCGITHEQINLKAKTNEKLGWEGRQEGMAAQVIALIFRP